MERLPKERYRIYVNIHESFMAGRNGRKRYYIGPFVNPLRGTRKPNDERLNFEIEFDPETGLVEVVKQIRELIQK